MSLPGHVCRRPFRRAVGFDAMWIGDTQLRILYEDFSRRRGCKRHGSSTPGPMEARKRATRRRMVSFAPPPVASPFDYITALWEENRESRRKRHDTTNLQETKPSPNIHRHESRSRSLLAAITERFSSPIQESSNPVKGTTPAAIEAYSMRKEVNNTEIFLQRVRRCRSIKDLHRIRQSSEVRFREHSHMIFHELMMAQKSLGMLLDVIVDPTLSLARTSQLGDLLIREVSASRSRSYGEEKARLIAQWTNTQITQGKLSNTQIYAVVDFLRIIEKEPGGKRKAYAISKAVVQGIENCNSLSLCDFDYRTVSFLMELLIHGAPTAEISDWASCMLGQMEDSLILRLRPSISRGILITLSRICTIPLNSSERVNGNLPDFEEIFRSLMDAVPKSVTLSVIDSSSEDLANNIEGFSNRVWNDLSEGWWNALSRNNFDLTTSARATRPLLHSRGDNSGNYLHVFAQHLTRYQLARLILRQWSGFSESGTCRIQELLRLRNANDFLWSMVTIVHAAGGMTTAFIRDLFGLLLKMNYPGAIIDIVRKARQHDVALPSSELERILGRLSIENTDSAHALFASDSRLAIEECLNLADHLLLGDNAPSGQIFQYFREEHGNLTPAPDSKAAFENGIDPADALTTHATAHAFRRGDYTSSQAFSLLDQCQQLYQDRQTGYNPPSLSRAFVSVGIILPLSRGEMLDPQQRRTILQLVARTEGLAVALEIDKVCKDWQHEVCKSQEDAERTESEATDRLASVDEKKTIE